MGPNEPGSSLTQAEIDALNKEFKDFIDELQRTWLRENNHRPKGWRLYELDPEEQRRVACVRHSWELYVTPHAERWWKKRGFGIRWPEKSSDPCKIYKLEVAAA